MFYDPEFVTYNSDIGGPDTLKHTPSWYNATFDFNDFFQKEASPATLENVVPKDAENGEFEELVASYTSRQASPVPTSPSTTTTTYIDDLDQFTEEPFSPFIPSLKEEVDVDNEDFGYVTAIVAKEKQKDLLKVITPKVTPKKVAANSKIPPKAKDKEKAKVTAVAVVPEVTRAPCAKMVSVPKKSPSPPPSGTLTDEERKERNKIAAQKYRQKCREQATDAQSKCNELLEEQKMLKMSIEQERGKITEIRELLTKHGLLPK